MRKKTKEKAIAWLVGVALGLILVVAPITNAIRMHQMQARLDAYEAILIRMNRNQKVLDNKLNQLHEESQFHFEIVPQSVQLQES